MRLAAALFLGGKHGLPLIDPTIMQMATLIQKTRSARDYAS